jgi:hypothetical protein
MSKNPQSRTATMPCLRWLRKDPKTILSMTARAQMDRGLTRLLRVRSTLGTLVSASVEAGRKSVFI